MTLSIRQVISKKALHEFLLMKCKEQTMEFTKLFKSKENTPKISKLKAELTTVINEGGSSEEMLDIENQIKELVDEDIVKDLKTEKSTTFLKMRDQARRSSI